MERQGGLVGAGDVVPGGVGLAAIGGDGLADVAGSFARIELDGDVGRSLAGGDGGVADGEVATENLLGARSAGGERFDAGALKAADPMGDGFFEGEGVHVGGGNVVAGGDGAIFEINLLEEELDLDLEGGDGLADAIGVGLEGALAGVVGPLGDTEAGVRRQDATGGSPEAEIAGGVGAAFDDGVGEAGAGLAHEGADDGGSGGFVIAVFEEGGEDGGDVVGEGGGDDTVAAGETGGGVVFLGAVVEDVVFRVEGEVGFGEVALTGGEGGTGEIEDAGDKREKEGEEGESIDKMLMVWYNGRESVETMVVLAVFRAEQFPGEMGGFFGLEIVKRHKQRVSFFHILD